MEGLTKEQLEQMLQESIELARKCGVPEDKIIHNTDELDSLLGW